MSNTQVSIVNVLKISGIICGYLIGGGFSSGQDLLQCYASHGIMGLGAVLVQCLVLTFTVVSFLKLGKSSNITNPHQVFCHYCGEKIAPIFEFIAFTYLIVQVIVFFTAAGAAIAEAFNVSAFVGSSIMGLVVIITVILGLNKLIDIISSLGVFLVIIVVSMVTIFLFKNPSGIMEGSEIVKTMDILQPSESWALSGFLYASYSNLGLAAFMPLVGSQIINQKDNIWGGIIGSIIFSIALSLVTLAFLSDIANVGTKLIPNLYIAEQIHPLLASAFSIIILMAIYTGCAPMFWNFCARIIPESNFKFKPFVIILGTISLVLGALLPFDKVINIVYLIYGYLGTIFLAFVLYKEFTSYRDSKK